MDFKRPTDLREESSEVFMLRRLFNSTRVRMDVHTPRIYDFIHESGLKLLGSVSYMCIRWDGEAS